MTLLPSDEAMRQAINRKKKKVKPEYQIAPIKLSDILIPEWLKFTYNEEVD